MRVSDDTRSASGAYIGSADRLAEAPRERGRVAAPRRPLNSFPDEVGVVTCDECGAHIETLEPLGLRRILPNYWSRLRGSVAPAIPPKTEL